MWKKILFVVISLCLFGCSYEDDYCYAKDDNPFLYFSHLTSYSVVSSKQGFETPDACVPIHAVAFIKHGVKYMSDEEIEKAKVLPEWRDKILQSRTSVISPNPYGRLCKDDYSLFENWELVLDKSRVDSLMVPGKNTLAQLARRLKQNLKTLFESSKESFEFYTGTTKLSKDSALAFINELLNLKITSTELTENGITESELLKQNIPNPGNSPEYVSYLKSSLIDNEIKVRVSRRLGFLQDLLFDPTILTMYETCAYERAWSINPRPAFCAAFTKRDLEAIEYGYDLRHYYSHGYGNREGGNYRKPIIKDILKRIMDAADQQTPSKKATLYFSDGSPISAALVELSQYFDIEDLKHDGPRAVSFTREWRSSIIDSFGSNLLTVLYSCSNNEKKVGFYHNEKLLTIPFCENKFCSVPKLKDHFKKDLDGTGEDEKEVNPKPNEPQNPAPVIEKPIENPSSPNDDKKHNENPSAPKEENKDTSGATAILINFTVVVGTIMLGRM